uniref:Translation factor n=1 Tax=Medicago truncatula TaxID=3880 RepID=A2Q1J7_MEDTR|nr:Translation factor [Medicago truncatula]
MSTKNSIATIVEITYPSILDSMTDIAYFQDKAILTTKNSIVKQINDYMFGFDSRQINCEGKSIAGNYDLDQSKNGEKHHLVALAFKLKKRGRKTYLRIYEGVLRKGDLITDVDTGKKLEIRRLLGLYNINDEVILEAHAGEIVGVIHSGPVSTFLFPQA